MSRNVTDGELEPPRSRRRFLAGAAAVLGIATAESLSSPQSARATQGQPVLAGESNTETSETSITNTAGDGAGLSATGAGGGTGLIGTGGAAAGAVGVSGQGGGLGRGPGVVGTSTFDVGVFGAGQPGVFGLGRGNAPGVRGISGGGGTGVEGIGVAFGGFVGKGVHGTGSEHVEGVWGDGGPDGGRGVVGVGGQGPNPFTNVPGTGVFGAGGGGGVRVQGTGVQGRAGGPGGVGVYAENVNGGVGLKVLGAAVFSRSGKVTVPAGSSGVIVNDVDLTADSLVLATLQQAIAGVYVESVVPDPANSRFTINLNKKASVPVGWFVVN